MQTLSATQTCFSSHKILLRSRSYLPSRAAPVAVEVYMGIVPRHICALKFARGPQHVPSMVCNRSELTMATQSAACYRIALSVRYPIPGPLLRCGRRDGYMISQGGRRSTGARTTLKTSIQAVVHRSARDCDWIMGEIPLSQRHEMLQSH